MVEFLRGWKRKVGVMTLIAACAAMICWVRSTFTDDTLVVLVGETWIFNLNSNQHGFGVVAAAYGTDQSSVKFHWLSRPIDPAESDPMSNMSLPVRLEFPGFHFGYTPGQQAYGICLVSYYYAIIPLTALSTWLLLSGPSRSSTRSQDAPCSTGM